MLNIGGCIVVHPTYAADIALNPNAIPPIRHFFYNPKFNEYSENLFLEGFSFSRNARKNKSKNINNNNNNNTLRSTTNSTNTTNTTNTTSNLESSTLLFGGSVGGNNGEKKKKKSHEKKKVRKDFYYEGSQNMFGGMKL